jgi:hypothetical protein
MNTRWITRAEAEAIYGPAQPRPQRRRVQRLRAQATLIRFVAEEKAKRLEAEADSLEQSHG